MVRIKLLEKILNNSYNGGNGNNASRASKSVKSPSSHNAASNRNGQSTSAATTAAAAAAATIENEVNMRNGCTSRRFSSVSGSGSSSALLNESVFSGILNENFICNCCLEVLKNPCTLMCGHSFCQLCLADWYLISSNRRCPICRQEWFGVPKQNQALKATIKRLIKYDSATNSTYNDKLTKEEEKKLKTFHQKCHQYSSWSTLTSMTSNAAYHANMHQRGGGGDDFAHVASNASSTSLNNFFAGLFFGVLLATVVLTLGSFISPSTSPIQSKQQSRTTAPLNTNLYYYTNSLTSHSTSSSSSGGGGIGSVAMLRRKFAKPIELWSYVDIQEWLYSLGPWTNKIAIAAQSLKIDGIKLLQLNETNLKEPPFDVKEEEFRKLLIDSIRVLKGCRLTATSFWNIKNKNRFEFVFFSMFFESLPRLTFLYYYFLNDEIGSNLSVLAGLSQINMIDLSENDYVFIENVKKSMLYRESTATSVASLKKTTTAFQTFVYYTKLPFMRFKNVFNIFFYESNKPLSVFISIRCVLLTLLDVLFLVDLLRTIIEFDTDRLKHLLNGALMNNFKSLVFISFVYIFWNFIPNLLIDTLFFYLLFVRVFFNTSSLVNNFKAFLGSIGHYFIRPNH